MNKEIIFFLDSNRGQYLPRDFARIVKRDSVSGVKAEDLDYIARGPGGMLDTDESPADGETERGEFYWDTWETVVNNCVLTDPESQTTFKLWTGENGDLFLVPSDWEWDEDLNTYVPPESDTLIRFNLYSYWASYLFNGDSSGIDEADRQACDTFREKEDLKEWTCAGVSENTWFGLPDFGGLRGDIARFTFIKVP